MVGHRKLIFILLLLLIAAAIFSVIYFLPSGKKVLLPKKTENISSDPAIPSQEDTVSDEIPKENEKTDEVKNNSGTTAPYSKTEVSPQSDLAITNRMVNWGYAKSSASRSIDTIIIHSSYNALTSDPYSLDSLIAEYKSYGVSPHYLIDRKGKIYRLVKDNNIAYHAGESKMPDGRTDVNNFSLGIEMMNTENDQMTAAQYDALNRLIAYLKKNYKIKNILGHNQIAPGRKTDPWNFNWSKINK